MRFSVSPAQSVRGQLRLPGAMLDAGNSGSTIRMLPGMLAAQPFRAVSAARTLRPACTAHDEDLTIALGCGEEKADITAVGVAAVEEAEQAIVLSVRITPSLAGLPGLASLQPLSGSH